MVRKKQLLIMLVLGCMSISMPVSASQTQLYEEKFEKGITEDEMLEEYGISSYALEATWIQAADGRWWYRHSDGSYTVSNWEYINGAWYYFDSSGWMVTGWIKLNGIWYYLNDNGVMVTGWKCISEVWYYFNASGAMQTGWKYITFPGAYDGNPYYNYFDSSGAFVTDSDYKGCSHGYASFGDYNYQTYPNNIKYYTSCSKSQNKKIQEGVSSWNNNGITHVSKTYIKSEATMLFEETTFKSANVLARTKFYINFSWTSTINGNWTKTRIYVDNDQGIISSGTMAHEVGHAFGLAHRITNQNSVMCQTRYGRKVSSPQSIDIDVLKHIY